MRTSTLGLLLMAFMSPIAVHGDSEATSYVRDQQPPSAKSTSTKNRSAAITPTVEAEVLAFVKQQHGELLELLIHLKEGFPQEYAAALRDLNRTRQRLAVFQKRDSERYELERRRWKAQSQAQLLAARIQMSDDRRLREQLRSTLRDEYDLQLQILRRERERLADRLKKMNAQLQRLDQNRDASIDKEFSTLTKPSPPGSVPGRKKARRKEPPSTNEPPT